MSSISDLNSSAALFDRAVACRGRGELDQALALYEILARRHPRLPDVEAGRGEALLALGRWAEAASALDIALAERPQMREWIALRAIALQKQDRLRDALAEHERVLALAPGDAMAHYNLGTCLGAIGRLEEAIVSYDTALALYPTLVPALSNRGQAFVEFGRMEEAFRDYDTALRLAPKVRDVAALKGYALLLLGRFEEGLKLYEARMHRRVAKVDVPKLAIPIWTGREEIAGKSLLLHAEQGLGDTIHFCRYAVLAQARGARVILSVQPTLLRLLGTLSPDIRLVDETEPPPAADYHAMLASLPLAFGTRLDTIPAAATYLSAEPERAAQWAARIGAKGFRIGIAWQCSTLPHSDKARAISLAHFAELAKLPNVRLISLQKGSGMEQLGDPLLGLQVENLGPEFDNGPDAFVDSAAVMRSLDLVISCDTAIAHLAGALGKPVWVVLKSVPDWRWLLDRADSPWYPTVRLFRQTQRGDWTAPFQAIEKALAETVATAGSDAPHAPVSWGELLDKIAILEIKRERISDATAKANVMRELAVLRRLADPVLVRSDVAPIFLDLADINRQLWEIEDNIRGKEDAKSFDAEFVDLARAVYQVNDRRAALKRAINQILGSTIIEEKAYSFYRAPET